MTIFRAPLTNSKGEVMMSSQASGVVPAQATQFRGMWVTLNGLICCTPDTGQARTYKGGFVVEDPSGLVMTTETAPASVPMDGINAGAAGSVVTKTGAASLIHQGVAMTVSGPGGPMIVNKDEPALTFHAGLEYQSNSGSIQGAQIRDSEATYRAQDGRLKVAAPNWIRQEFQNGQSLGTLMEPAATNRFLNSATPVTQTINLGIGDYVFSVFGSGSLTSANAGGTATGHGTAIESNPITITVTVAGDFSFTVAGFLDYAQVESGKVPTSIILTKDSAATRAIDQLTWSLADPQGRNILNQTQGMAAVIFQPQYDSSDLPATTVQGLVSLRDSAISLIYHNRNAGNDAFVTDTRAIGSNTATAIITGGFSKNTQMVIPVRWNTATNLQIGFKRAGTWAWGGGTFTTEWENNGNIRLSRLVQLPMYMSNLYFWTEDKGQAWLESFFSGVAN